MGCDTPGSSVLHCHLEFAQVHLHWVGDAIPPSHPLLPSSSFAFHLFQHQGHLHRSLSFSFSPSNEYSGLISFRTDCLNSLQSNGLLRVFSSNTIQKHQFFTAQPFLWLNTHIHTRLLEKPSVQFSHLIVPNSATPWTAACHTSLSITNSRSLIKLMFI